MSGIVDVFNNIGNHYLTKELDTVTILSVLIVVLLLSIYEFIIYRFVSHRTFYNKSFNISLAIIPFFIATIILCLQSNLVITLGTIGALAIIRYRTVVKDPIDMVYILWAVHIGIICGCQLYEVAILTSVFVTLILLVLENISFGKNPYVLIIHSKDLHEGNIETLLKKNTKKYSIKSKNYTSDGIDFAIEFSSKDTKMLVSELKKNKDVIRFSLIKYDSNDIM